MDRLKDKVAIITGAAAGIGEATDRLFAEEGAKLALVDVAMDPLEKVAADIRSRGGEALPIRCNVAVEAEVKAMVKTVIERYGKIHILINNAGITRDMLSPRLSEEAWDAVMNVNLKGTFFCSKHALIKMERGGKVINTASIAVKGNPGQANYAASKMGIIGLTRTQALEYARKKICINCVAPGAIDTPMLAKISDEAKKGMLDKIPFGEPIPPIEIAHAHLFFASDDSRYITGQTLFVDGGMSIGF
jgi:NAD(P)-dependent dehydrogenase (short-subunit alcohol dehydrogenase family)